jgi:hypothetical protein
MLQPGEVPPGIQAPRSIIQPPVPDRPQLTAGAGMPPDIVRPQSPTIPYEAVQRAAEIHADAIRQLMQKYGVSDINSVREIVKQSEIPSANKPSEQEGLIMNQKVRKAVDQLLKMRERNFPKAEGAENAPSAKAKAVIGEKPGVETETEGGDAIGREAAPDDFNKAITKANNESKYKGFVTIYPTEKYAEMKVHLNSEKNAGYALTPDNEIASLFNASHTPGVGTKLLKEAIAKGGDHLYAFEGYLTKHYGENGFVPGEERYKFDDNLAPEGWNY